MATWWDGLGAYNQALFIIGVATTLFMIIQIIVMIAGGDDTTFDQNAELGDGAGGDEFNDDGIGITIFGLRVLTLRSLVAFLALGSWVTFTFNYALPVWGSTIIGVICGIAAAFGVAYLMKSVEKLQSNGAVLIKNAVGKSGEVYLVIPANRSGNGKVNVFVQERYTEYEAVTDDNEPIKTGDKVNIVGVLNEGTLIVERMGNG